VVGAALGPAAVAVGALELLRTPATGVPDGLAGLADSLAARRVPELPVERLSPLEPISTVVR
jgi:hypothetical protein